MYLYCREKCIRLCSRNQLVTYHTYSSGGICRLYGDYMWICRLQHCWISTGDWHKGLQNLKYLIFYGLSLISNRKIAIALVIQMASVLAVFRVSFTADITQAVLFRNRSGIVWFCREELAEQMFCLFCINWRDWETLLSGVAGRG